MKIHEFYSKFVSMQEKSRLFDALRRLSGLDSGVILAAETPGWAEWPPADGPGSGSLLVKA
ncbi:MAG TPA: hypothetical protein VKK31_26075 [Thermoanaerobaculia bacterium]|nr:hypothetical protein [Thermoanaerobaculia bacterium]